MDTTPVAPHLLACAFRAPTPSGEGADPYVRLARVLAFSARQHCPSWTHQVEILDPPPSTIPGATPAYAANTHKLQWWRDRVAALPDGTRVLCLDADMLVLQPLEPLWDLAFDLAYTARVGGTSRLPFNGGFLALRVSPRTRAAMDRYVAENWRMLTDAPRHAVYRRRFAGLNQAAFGACLELGAFTDCTVVRLPCPVWNCVAWETFHPATTRVLHIKSDLRRTVLQGTNLGTVTLLLAEKWHQAEAAMARRELQATG
jgi:hypothetical protein